MSDCSRYPWLVVYECARSRASCVPVELCSTGSITGGGGACCRYFRRTEDVVGAAALELLCVPREPHPHTVNIRPQSTKQGAHA